MRTQSAFFAVAFALSLTAACGGSSDAPQNMRLEKTCLETKCDQLHQHHSNACAACTSACLKASYNCDPGSACELSCSPSGHCTDADNACVRSGFKADMPTSSSTDLEAACKRWSGHAQECQIQNAPADIDCKTFAKTERPELSKVYDCIANLSCDGLDPSSCNLPSSTDFGDKLCDSIEAKCAGVCDAKTRDGLNIEGGWLRADVMASASTCATQTTCEDVRGCFAAWVKAVIR